MYVSNISKHVLYSVNILRNFQGIATRKYQKIVRTLSGHIEKLLFLL